MDNMFIDWLNDQMRDRGWTQADLARAANIDTAVISNLVNQKRGPGFKSCTAIANALRVHPNVVLQMAGLMDRPLSIKDDAILSEINSIYPRLDPENRIDALEYFRLRLRLQDEKGKHAASPNDVPASPK